MSSESQYSIILSGGTPTEVAPAMAKLFGIDPRLAGQIAGAAPIVIVEDLDQGQAAGVRAALGELVAAGAEITVKAGSVGSIPKVGWGGVPKISGKLATQYTGPAASGGAGSFCCPSCGAVFRLVPEGASAPSAPAAAPPPAAAPKPKPKSTQDSGFEEIPLPDALKALEAPPDLPDVPEIPSAAPKPAAAPQPAQPVGGAISVNQVKPGHSAPMALEDFEAGLASDDNMLADLDDGLPDVPEEAPRPVPAKKPLKKPLVQVEGLEEIGVQPLNAPPKAPPAAKPAALKARPAAPKAKAAAPRAMPAGKPRPATVAPSPEDGGGDPNEKVNIFANKSNSPKMAELLAKIRGISVAEAEDLAQKPLVTVARNISRKQAEVIKKKFTEHKISVRLSPVRASQRMKPPDISV